jgi:hypothetical protein
MHLSAYHCSEGFKLGSEALFDFLFEVLYLGVNGGMHFFIYGANIVTELCHFLWGFFEINVQGIKVSFQVLATGVGHDEEGTLKGAGETAHKMGYG